jgi:outer membrane protein assembly factor BamB
MRGLHRRKAVVSLLAMLTAVGAMCPSSVSPAAAPQAKAQATDSSSDWSQWRGPKRDNLSTGTALLKQWPKDGPPLAWKTRGIGSGYSTVSIAGDRIYTMGDGKESSYVHALELNGGRKIWSAKVGRPGGDYPGTRSTPTVDGDRVYALGQHGDLVCLDAATGSEHWRKSLTKDFGGRMMSGWGYAESVLVDGDKVVCTPGGNKGTILALNKTSGDVVWRTEDFTDDAAYSSLVPCEIGGVRQYVQLTDESVVGVAADTGDVLWRSPRHGETAVIPTPVVHGNHVFVTSGYNIGCNLFRVTPQQGGKFKVDQVYANKDMENHHGGVVLVGDHVYGTSGNQLVCMNLMTGKVAWKDRSVGKGAVAYADGNLYVRSEGGDGTVALVEATPRGYREKGRFDQPDRSNTQSWPQPVIAGGKLYLRDQDVLLCYDVKAK